MRKVNTDDIKKPTIKIIMQVYMPYNDGSGGGELVEATDLCYLDESNSDISNMARGLIADAKQVARHHIEVMRIKKRSNANTVTGNTELPAAKPAGFDKMEAANDPAPKRKAPARKKPAAKKAVKK